MKLANPRQIATFPAGTISSFLTIFVQLKKLIYILVLAIVVLQVDILWVGYGVQQYYLTQKMRRGEFSPADVKELVLTVDEYRALPESEEIVFNSRMYDVQEVKFNGTSVLIKAVEDTEECQLIVKMKNLDHKTRGNFGKQLSQLLQLNYLPTGGQSIHYYPSLSAMHFPSEECYVQAGYLEINCPPPRRG